jgi:hypothetical protein
MTRNYDYVRFTYQEPIERYAQDALAKAAARAVAKQSRWLPNGVTPNLGFAYRVIDNTYASSDPWGDGDNWSFNTRLEIIAFPIIAQTPRGFRIWRGGSEDSPETRFVSRDWTKCWANETPEGALRDYAERRRRQASIYEARAGKARGLERDARCLLERAQTYVKPKED